MSNSFRLALDAIALTGPTASGKTGVALFIAKQIPIEIISVDSALVYRGMDIGTAKPNAHELAQVPHHLINIRDPRETYSAAEFVKDATQLIAEIKSREKLPLLVGGTMLYLKALREGIDDLPKANPQIRAEIEQQAKEMGWPRLHDELNQIDSITAARLAPLDAQRISRALEVWRVSGIPLSQWFVNAASDRTTRHPTLKLPIVSLEPRDRSWLHERIALRFAAMLENGFLQEMDALRARGDLDLNLPSMRCVGYRQAWELLDKAALAQQNPKSIVEQLSELGIAATRQLAKRQITWLRSMTDRCVIACDSDDPALQTLDEVKRLIAKSL